MLKDVLVLFIPDLVEIIHVELPDEGREVAMPKVDGKDLLLEAVNVEDGEVGSLLVPGDNLQEAIVLNPKKCTSRI